MTQLARANRRIIWSFVAVTLVATLVLAGFGFQIEKNHQLGREGAGADAALCVLRHDYAVRIQEGEQYLAQHPHGAPGIPASAIRVSLFNQQHTLKALAGLRCPPKVGSGS